MTTTDSSGLDSERILGHVRIFQSVFNDLNMDHEIVTDKDGKQRYAYVYHGVDPYELEDSAFPNTVALIRSRKAAEDSMEKRQALIDRVDSSGMEWLDEALAKLVGTPVEYVHLNHGVPEFKATILSRMVSIEDVYRIIGEDETWEPDYYEYGPAEADRNILRAEQRQALEQVIKEHSLIDKEET